MQVDFCLKGLILRAEITTWPAKYEAGFQVESVSVLENEDDLTDEEIVAVLADKSAIESAVDNELEELAKDQDYEY